VTRLRNLKDSFHEAEHAFAGRFTSRINQIIYLRELQGHGDNEEAPSMKGLGTVELNREAISKFLRNGTEEEVDSFVGACFSEMPEDNLRSMMMRQYILMDIYVTVASFGEGMEIEQEEIEKACGDMQGIMDNLSDIQKMKNHACRILKGMVLLRDTVSGHRYSDIIENAQEYILKNYMSENISLNAVAVSVNLSPSYFSSIFSQEVGQTFVEYLTGIRMEKAKELLMCSSKKTSEIGYEVGYKDSHYFSYIFKKTQKCTPKEYRARGKV
jgi:two-component system response regulator YesN